jgi:hypothetical protein
MDLLALVGVESRLRTDLGTSVPNVHINFSLDDAIAILRDGDNRKLYEARRVKASNLDYFLLSGRFNSVLGLAGFNEFKARLKILIERVNAANATPQLINLDEMFEVLLSSGLYYVDEHLPAELSFLTTDDRWLTAYRYIACNFPDIGYRDFRTIVSRLKDANGHAFYVERDDSAKLRGLLTPSRLFQMVVDAKAALMQLSLRELRDICARTEIAPARSRDATVSRIVEKCGDQALAYVQLSHGTRSSLIMRDVELATGADLIQLDRYLREIAKVVREDLIAFVGKRRTPLSFLVGKERTS